MKFHWIGGPTFRLELGQFNLMSDPVLGEGPSAFVLEKDPSTGEPGTAVARLAELPSMDHSGLDCILVTEVGADHFDAAAVKTLDRDSRLIVPKSSSEAVCAMGFKGTSGLRWWEELTAQKSGESLKVTAVPVRRSSGERRIERTERVNGYVIEHTAAGKRTTAYVTGGTVWFSLAREIKERCGDVDLFVPHLGAVGMDGPFGMMSLSGKEAMQFVFVVHPKLIIPVNHHTFSHYRESVEDFRTRVQQTLYDRRLVVLKEGETFEKKEREE